MERRELVGRLVLAIGVVGLLAAVAGTVVGLRLLTALDDALESSLGVTESAVAALADTVELADDTVADVESSLRSAAGATSGLAGNLDEAQGVLQGAAEVTREDVAGSLAAVEASLPALIDVASVIDSTLSGLSRVPFGPQYSPDEPFDDSLRTLQGELDGLPETVREQADLLSASAGDLSSVADDAAEVGEDLDQLATTLGRATTLLAQYADTASEADAVLGDATQGLTQQLTAARVLVVVLGLALAAGQVVPIGIGWLLRNPEQLAAWTSAT